jgi:hypothetical protein
VLLWAVVGDVAHMAAVAARTSLLEDVPICVTRKLGEAAGVLELGLESLETSGFGRSKTAGVDCAQLHGSGARVCRRVFGKALAVVSLALGLEGSVTSCRKA